MNMRIMHVDLPAIRKNAIIGLVVFLIGALGGFVTNGRALADTVIVGTYDGGPRSEPFGGYPSGEYEQIYSSTAFSGPMTITSVGFATAPGNPSDSGPETFSLALSTTSASVASPSSTYSDNYGPDLTTVFSGTLSLNPKSDGSFDFVIPTSPFTYDPSKGTSCST